MKKLAALAFTAIYLLFTTFAFACDLGVPHPPSNVPCGNIGITNPDVGYNNISDFINAALRLAFIIAIIAVLVMMIWGAIQWIFSGGEKEAVAGARNRIIHALIGLAILAVAFAIVQVAGKFVGIDLLKPGGFAIPSPRDPLPRLGT